MSLLSAFFRRRLAQKAIAGRVFSLRGRLVLLVVGSLIPLLTFILGEQYLRYREDVAATGRQTLALARSMSLVVDQELQSRIIALEALTNAQTFETGDLDEFRTTAEAAVTQLFPGSNIILLREDGQQIMNTILPRGAPLPVRRNLESTRQVFATARPSVSNLYEGAVGTRPVVAVDVPVKKPDGAVAFVLSLNPRLEAFAEVIRRQDVPSRWVVSIVDRHGVIIARTPDGARFVGHEVSSTLLSRLLAEPEGIAQATSLEGVPVLTAFSHAGRDGWAVAIGVPMADISGPAAGTAVRTLAVGALVLAIGLLFALHAAKRIALPIGVLRDLAVGSDRDALLDPPPTGLRETDEVALALKMTEDDRRRAEHTAMVLRAGIDTISAGFVIYDDQDRLFLCNQSYRMFYPETADLLVPGIRFEDILRHGLARGRFPAARGREEEWLAERLHRQREPEGLIEQRLNDGRWVLVTKNIMTNGYVAGLRIDVTALKVAEQALNASEARLRRAQSLVHMGSEVRDRHTGEVEWSDETFRIFGLTRETAVPSPDVLSQLCHADDRETVAMAESQIRLGVCPRPYECRITRGADGIRYIHLEYELTDDDEGAPRYLTGTIQDITERRRTEALLHQAQKMEAIGTLTGGIAHDFNNLLGVMILNLTIAQRLVADTEPVKTLVGDALASARSGADLIRGLLAFARRQPLRPTRVDINQLVSTMTNLLSRIVREDILIVLDLMPDLWPVIGDPSQIEACIVNLATNARDAMPNGGQLTIATRNQYLNADYARLNALAATGDFVMISVSDTGTGMTQEVIARAFEPFFTTKEQGKGTGLGLSMVFGFARQSGGHVSIYSEPGMGTTIHIYLPCASETSASTDVADSPGRSTSEAGRGETVLVVEDNAGMRDAVVRQLRGLNYRVLEADSGRTALTLLESETVDMIFSDVVMPGGMNGFDLAERVRMRWPAIAMLLTSGFSGDQRNAWSDNPERPGLLSKPYDQDQLAKAVREALDGRHLDPGS